MQADAISAKSKTPLVACAALMAGSMWLLRNAITEHGPVETLISVGLVGWFGVLVCHCCYRLDLRFDGDVVLHYIYGRRVVTPMAISEIKFTEGESEGGFVVTVGRSPISVSANQSMRRMMTTLLRLNPSIRVKGDDWNEG